MGGAAIDALGTPLPDDTLAACKDSDAVLLAAIGGYAYALSTNVSLAPSISLWFGRYKLGSNEN